MVEAAERLCWAGSSGGEVRGEEGGNGQIPWRRVHDPELVSGEIIKPPPQHHHHPPHIQTIVNRRSDPPPPSTPPLDGFNDEGKHKMNRKVRQQHGC